LSGRAMGLLPGHRLPRSRAAATDDLRADPPGKEERPGAGTGRTTPSASSSCSLRWPSPWWANLHLPWSRDPCRNRRSSVTSRQHTGRPPPRPNRWRSVGIVR